MTIKLKIMKKINFQIAAFSLTLMLAVGLAGGCNKDDSKSNNNASSGTPHFPPKGTTTTDEARKNDFLDLPSNEAGKTNREIIRDANLARTFKLDHNGKLQQVILNRYPQVAGILDLTGCDALEAVDLSNTHISEIKISKKSYLGKILWIYEGLKKADQDMNAMRTGDLGDFSKRLKKDCPPTGDVILHNVYNGIFYTQKYGTWGNSHEIWDSEKPCFENATNNLKVTLVD